MSGEAAIKGNVIRQTYKELSLAARRLVVPRPLSSMDLVETIGVSPLIPRNPVKDMFKAWNDRHGADLDLEMKLLAVDKTGNYWNMPKLKQAIKMRVTWQDNTMIVSLEYGDTEIW